jgi:hypothetical protein
LLRIGIAVIPVYKPLPLTQFQHFLHYALPLTPAISIVL